MNGDTKALVQLLVEFIYEKPKVAEVSPSAVPSNAQALVTKWASSINLPVDDPDTSVTITQVKSERLEAYIYDYSGDDPDLFRAMCVVEGDAIIGQSVDVGD